MSARSKEARSGSYLERVFLSSLVRKVDKGVGAPKTLKEVNKDEVDLGPLSNWKRWARERDH